MTTKLARPFFRAGGRSSWQDLVVARMPACKRYVELYAGPSALFWRRTKDEGVQEVLIDLDRDAIKLCKWLRDATTKQREDMRARTWSWDPTTFERVSASKPKTKTDAAYKIKYLDLFSTAEGKLDSSDAARKRTAKSFLDALESFGERLKDVELVVGNPLDKLAAYDDVDTLVFADVPSEIETDTLTAALGKLTKAKAIIGAAGSVSVPNWKRVEISTDHGTARSTVLVNFDQPAEKGVIDPRTDYVWYRSGAHSHTVDFENREAAGYSCHAHMFAINGMLIETDWDGDHRHYIDPEGVKALSNTTAHQHEVEFGEVELETELDGYHEHDLIDHDYTAYDGAHRHVLNYNGKSYVSLSALEFWAMFVETEVVGSHYTTYSYDVAVLERAGKQLLALSSGDDAIAYELDGDLAKGCSAVACKDLAGAKLLGKAKAERGLVTDGDNLVELFMSGDALAGQLILERSKGDTWVARLHTKVCPLVLTPAALDIQIPKGASLLPSSLAKQISKSGRYWEADDQARAHAMRSAVVRKGLGHVACLAGEFVRVNYQLAASPAEPLGEFEPITADTIASKATGLPLGEGLTKHQPGETFKSFGLHAFRVRGDATIYASKQAPAESPHIEVVKDHHLDQTKLYACKADGEERFVLGIVLEPLEATEPDLQNDFYSAETIRKAAHDYMIRYGHVGWHHEAIVDGKVSIVESYIAPVSYEVDAIDGTKVTVKQGTWLMGFRVHDDKLWEQTKTGIGGLSIGGWSRHRIAE